MKSITRFLALLLVAVLMLTSFAACGKESEGSKDFYGTWVFSDNMIRFVFNEDGTATCTYYNEDGTIDSEITDMTFKIKNDTLIIDNYDTKVTKNDDGTLEVEDLGTIVKQ